LAYDAMPRRGSRDDDRRRGRDEEEPEREPHEELQELLAELEPEEQQIVLDAVYDMLAKKGGVDYGSDRRRARDRRRAADQPPLFEGRPEPGGTMTWSEREARDRRRATFANDMAQGTGRGFLDFFPDAKRIGTGGGF
jgi:hypothetical protein